MTKISHISWGVTTKAFTVVNYILAKIVYNDTKCSWCSSKLIADILFGVVRLNLENIDRNLLDLIMFE